MRFLLLITLLVAAGCEKAKPRSSAGKPYEAERIRTLTHDEDLTRSKAASDADLRSAGEALRQAPGQDAPPK